MSFRRLYGSSPLHLAGHVLAFAAFVWAFRQILGGGYVVNYIAWFVGAAILHDIVLVPVYSLIDRIARRPRRRSLGPWINYLRAPAIISAILLLVYAPLILGYSDRNYRNDTGHAVQHELRNWLLITAGLFACSVLVFVARHARGWLRADAARPAAGRGQSRAK
jgi:Na+/melibiose symporter-like transporter